MNKGKGLRVRGPEVRVEWPCSDGGRRARGRWRGGEGHRF